MSNGPEADSKTAGSRVSQADVARRAGVSVSVVSRELNRDPRLRARPETRRRIQEAAQELGYTPSHAARSLRLARAFAVGVVVPDLVNPIYNELVSGIDETAESLGYHVLIARTEHLEPGADFLRRLAGEGRVDGFLIQRRDETDQREFTALADAGGRPVILMNARWPRRGSVVHDDEGAGRLATQHLLDLGHREIALLGGVRHSHTALARERGYLQAIHGAAMRRRSAWVVERPYQPGPAREAMIELCTGGRRRPTAVVVANLNAAIGALQGARDVGLEVPDQLSIVAIHDWWITDYTRPTLTSVRMPQRALGRAAMQMLDRCLGGQPAEDLTVTDPAPRLIQRESTGPPPRRLRRARAPEGARMSDHDQAGRPATDQR